MVSRLFVVFIFSTLVGNRFLLADGPYTISAQGIAFTADAGGQSAYSLRFSDSNIWEYSLFLNEYIVVGAFPLVGAVASKRWSLCGSYCPLNLYAQLGVGLSNIGPMVELIWGSTWLWIARIDVASHMYVSRERVITWSLPLWLGLSIPF